MVIQRAPGIAVVAFAVLASCRGRAPEPEEVTPVVPQNGAQNARANGAAAPEPVDPACALAIREVAALTSPGWWRDGALVRCPGSLTPAASFDTPGLGVPIFTCADPATPGGTRVFFERGDGACPAGSHLTGAPPPIAHELGCLDANESPTGRIMFWNEDGTLQSTAEMRGGVKVGRAVDWDHGVLKAVGRYDAGQLDGTTCTYLPGPRIDDVQTWAHGVKHGLYSMVGARGTVVVQFHYDHGLPHGAVRSWTDGGRELASFRVEHGTGPWLLYYPSGELMFRGQITAGKRQGDWTYLDTSGHVLRTDHYQDDVLVSDAR